MRMPAKANDRGSLEAVYLMRCVLRSLFYPASLDSLPRVNHAQLLIDQHMMARHKLGRRTVGGE